MPFGPSRGQFWVWFLFGWFLCGRFLCLRFRGSVHISILQKIKQIIGNLLAKRLDSFNEYEAAQFEAALSKLELSDMTDIINLTFCCQQATVITDFSDLEKVGKVHFLTVQGGCAPKDELDALDGYETALLLIGSGAGVVTPYGVLYDNGMKLEQVYDGTHFPEYHYDPDLLTFGLTSRSEPECANNITWLYFPAAKGQIDRAILRSGITDPKDMCF